MPLRLIKQLPDGKDVKIRGCHGKRYRIIELNCCLIDIL